VQAEDIVGDDLVDSESGHLGMARDLIADVQSGAASR